MKEATFRVLEHWRARQWALIRPRYNDEPSTVFLATSIISRLCDKIHVCTSLECLTQVIGERWDYWDSHGAALFVLILATLAGFDEIFRTVLWLMRTLNTYRGVTRRSAMTRRSTR